MVQCPNCGGYRTTKFQSELVERPSFGEKLVAILLTISWVGILFGLPMLLDIGRRNREWREQQKKLKKGWTPSPWGEYGYACDICGYQWLQPPGTQPPVSPVPGLLQKGEQRLREEERKRKEEEDFLLG